MKKLNFLIIGLTLTACLALAQPSAGQSDRGLELLTNVGENAGFNQDQKGSALPQVAGSVLFGFLSLLGVIFMAYVVYAGWLWLTAAGNDEQIGKAKKILRGSIIGLAVVLSAYLITNFVIEIVIEAEIFNA